MPLTSLMSFASVASATAGSFSLAIFNSLSRSASYCASESGVPEAAAVCKIALGNIFGVLYAAHETVTASVIVKRKNNSGRRSGDFFAIFLIPVYHGTPPLAAHTLLTAA